LYKNLLNFEVFGEQWAVHNRSLGRIANAHLDRIEDMMKECYGTFLVKTNKCELFQKFVSSRVTMAINTLKARIMKKLADYERIFYNRQRGGLWGMRPILFAKSQEILFSHLSKKEKKDPKHVEKAIRDRMRLAAQEGVHALFVQPSEILASLRCGNGTDEQGDECMKLRSLCHIMFERSVKQLSTCKSGELTELKERIGLLNSKLSEICTRLQDSGRSDVAKYEPSNSLDSIRASMNHRPSYVTGGWILQSPRGLEILRFEETAAVFP
jgi:hypothetical protein